MGGLAAGQSWLYPSGWHTAQGGRAIWPSMKKKSLREAVKPATKPLAAKVVRVKPKQAKVGSASRLQARPSAAKAPPSPLAATARKHAASSPMSGRPLSRKTADGSDASLTETAAAVAGKMAKRTRTRAPAAQRATAAARKKNDRSRVSSSGKRISRAKATGKTPAVAKPVRVTREPTGKRLRAKTEPLLTTPAAKNQEVPAKEFEAPSQALATPLPLAFTTVTPALPSKSPEPPPAAVRLSKSAPKAEDMRSTVPPSFYVPPILLEGDEPTTAPIPRKVVKETEVRQVHEQTTSIPLGAAARSEPVVAAKETASPVHLLLTARDPRCVYASWEMAPDRQQRFNALSADGRLVLRLRMRTGEQLPQPEARLHADSQHWFCPVSTPGEQYVAELGYYDEDRLWASVAVSNPAETPPEAIRGPELAVLAHVAALWSEEPAAIPPKSDRPVEAEPQQSVPEPRVAVANVPALGISRDEQPFGDLHVVRTEVPPLTEPVMERAGGVRATEAPIGLPAASHTVTPSGGRSFPVAQSTWRSEAEKKLYSLALAGIPAPTALSSAELLRPVVIPAEEIQAAPTSAEFVSPVPQQAGQAITSPALMPPPPAAGRQFWLRVNAELVIYGATEPDASVSISGRSIRLRQDGTFSYRFALPDGEYDLCVSAVSAAGDDGRQARLQFSRSTEYKGEVGEHPQDPALRVPAAENL